MTAAPKHKAEGGERGFNAGLDHIANFINSLDSEGMTGAQVRSAIYSECLTATHKTAPPSPLVPEGYRLVPVEPTEAMIEAAKDARHAVPDGSPPGVVFNRAYAAMLSTSPIPSTQPEAGWRSMESAPKDGSHVLLWADKPWAGAIRGRFDSDPYATNPLPYWTTDDERLCGKVSRRANQPTHWMPLPTAPSGEPS